MSFIQIRRAAVAFVLLAAAGCTVKTSDAPAVSGPSNLALSLTVNASPDTVSQDGGSQSAIKVTAIGPNGKPMSSIPIRMDMKVNGVAVDYGTLSARSLITNSDGVAAVVYTAPPPPPNGTFTPCTVEPFNASMPGGCVSIFATATSSDFAAASPQSVLIRLVPTGVILPPASTPVASFIVSPTPVNSNVPTIFDATASCGAPLVSGRCTGSSPITSFAWSFGDGSSDSGSVVTHTFTGANTYTVTLTVTNNGGGSTSTSQSVAVSASAPPTGDWVFSPASPSVGETVFFSADAVKPAPGRTLVSYNWNFGDGTTSTGSVTSHSFFTGASYVVVLTVIDDAGQKAALTKTIVIGSGNPVANLLISKTGGVNAVQADGSGSTSQSGTAILNYTFNFGDGTPIVSSSSPTAPHTYTAAGTYTVRLTVTDSLGRTGTTTGSIAVP
jgi:PKD repeat protein